MPCFASQLPQTADARSLRASQYRPAKKRKRDHGQRAQDDDDEEEAQSQDTNFASAASRAVSPDAAQLRVAGLLPGDAFEVPAPPFPHAPARSPKGNFSSQKLQKELAGLDPPLFAVAATSKTDPVNRQSKRPALRETHLGVLTAVLHQCLLDGDFQRAGRAWGMVLRTQIAGLHIDPRNHARWGIGAEILLRRHPDPSHSHTESAPQQSPSNPPALYTKEGFELARRYYERLIIQHPHKKHVRNAVDALTFYPAMFSLWIYEASESSKQALLHVKDDDLASTSEDTSMHDTDTISSPTNARDRASAIKAEELYQARQIADRIDELVSSPPFDKHADMLQLRGMVGVWMSDLIVWDDVSHDDNLADPSRSLSTVEKLDMYSWSERVLRQAVEFLQRAEANGRHLEDYIAQVDAKINRTRKKIARLND